MHVLDALLREISQRTDTWKNKFKYINML